MKLKDNSFSYYLFFLLLYVALPVILLNYNKFSLDLIFTEMVALMPLYYQINTLPLLAYLKVLFTLQLVFKIDFVHAVRTLQRQGFLV